MMFKVWNRAIPMLLLSASFVFSEDRPLVHIPDTPAGHTLEAWLDALNSGDRSKLETYVKTIDPSESVDGMLTFEQGTGGFNLLSVESSEPLHIRFRVKEKASMTIALGNLLVQAGQPAKVKTFGMRPLPPGVTPVNVVVDEALQARVIEGISVNLRASYIDAAVAGQMIQAIQAQALKGDYKALSDGDAFAARLTDDLQSVSHDKHLRVTFNPFKNEVQHDPTPQDIARFHEELLHDNCRFDKIEILPGNIAYIKFHEFADASFCGQTVASAMGFAEHADAVIFDLRENGGGASRTWSPSLQATCLSDPPT